MLDPRRNNREDLEVKVPPKSKLTEMIQAAKSTFSLFSPYCFLLTTNGTEHRITYGEQGAMWRGHDRVAFLKKIDDEWHVIMINPDMINLLEVKDDDTTT